VKLTATGKALIFVAALLCLGSAGAGLGLHAVARRQAGEVRLLQQEGVDTDGRVIRLWRSGEHKEPYVKYRFQVQGRDYQRDAKLPLSLWARLRVGSTLAVRYAESRPEINHPAGLTGGAVPPWVPAWVAVALLVGGCLALLPLRQQLRMLVGGRQTLGLVVAHGKTMRTSHGSDLGRKYEYEFLLLSGASYKGKAGPTKNPPAIGSAIPVLYDPDNPKNNDPYPFSLVRLARH
jgi:hypothetical protein